MVTTLWEALLFASVAINAALLIFFAGVFRQIINNLDIPVFKNVVNLLVGFSKKSAFMIIGLNAPLIVAIPYYYFCGFGDWWMTAGVLTWLITGSISKFLKLPAYKVIAESADPARLADARVKVNRVNILQAALYSAATIVMIFGFS